MKKQGDNPEYDLVPIDEWSLDREKQTTLLLHFPHMKGGLSIRRMYDHFYEDSVNKESFLSSYFSSLGLTLKTREDRM